MERKTTVETRDCIYPEEIKCGFSYNNEDFLHISYEIYKKLHERDNRSPLSYDEWRERELKSLRDEQLETVKRAIFRYVYYEAGDYAFVKHEYWSDFMREIDSALFYKERKAYNELDYGFDLHFDLDFGISFKIKDVFGHWMTDQEFKEFYQSIEDNQDIEEYR